MFCNFYKKNNHLEEKCWKKNKENFVCNYCKKPRHLEKFCRTKKSTEAPKLENQNNLSHDESNSDNLFVASVASALVSKSNSWLIDSGCTNHMTYRFEIFTSINNSVRIPIKMGNGNIVNSEGKGTIGINTIKGLNIYMMFFMFLLLKKIC